MWGSGDVLSALFETSGLDQAHLWAAEIVYVLSVSMICLHKILTVMLLHVLWIGERPKPAPHLGVHRGCEMKFDVLPITPLVQCLLSRQPRAGWFLSRA